MKVKHLKEILEHYNDDCDVVLNVFESESAFDEHKDFLMEDKKDWFDKRRTAKYNGILVDVGDIHFLGKHWISLVTIDGFLEEKDLTSDRILDSDVEMTTKDCFHCYYAQSNEDGIHCYRKTRTKVKGTNTCEHYKK